MSEQTFGAFVTRKRLDCGITLREFARRLEISPVYMCNIEKDRRQAPATEIVEKMVVLLTLSETDRLTLLDLAAASKNKPTIALDLPDYINERDIVRAALRTAKDADATDEEWQEFIDRLKKRVQSYDQS